MSWDAKRFWKTVRVNAVDDAFGVFLDDRAVLTPGKSPLHVPTMALADAIAQEWDQQEGKIDPYMMPCTRAANSALEKILPNQAAIADMLAEYADTDLICYRADSPDRLKRKQSEAWDPILEWVKARFDTSFVLVEGVMYQQQPAQSVAVLRHYVHQQNPFELMALHDLVTLSGSLLLGVAVYEGQITAEQAFDLSRIDEAFQEEQWGVDEEAARDAALKREQVLQAARFLALLRS